MTPEARASLIDHISVISAYAQLQAGGIELTPSEVKRYGQIIKLHSDRIMEELGLRGRGR